MPANHSSARLHYWQGRYGGLGHLYSPGGERGPYPHLPYALDNGAYASWKRNEGWNRGAFERLLSWADRADKKPLWVVAPDVVSSWPETITSWKYWRPIIERQGFTPALALQDGCDFRQALLENPEVVFVGGSLEWKWLNLESIARTFVHAHVARVNRPQQLWRLKALGIDSCDGTGWFRGDEWQAEGLRRFLAGEKPAQQELDFTCSST